MYVGSVGSSTRKEHAVVGDTVNSAARLSGKAMTLVDRKPEPTLASTSASAEARTLSPTHALDEKEPKLPRRNRLILIDEHTYTAVHHKLRCVARGEINVKGKAKTIKIFSPAPTKSDPEAVGTAALQALVGRTHELDDFKQLLSGAKLATNSSAWLITAKPGFGKTLLLRHFQATAKADPSGTCACHLLSCICRFVFRNEFIDFLCLWVCR